MRHVAARSGWVATLSAVALAAWEGAGPALAAPEPSPIPKSWELAFSFDDLQRIDVTLPGDSAPTAFWYVLFTVQNDSGQDVNFSPEFELFTRPPSPGTQDPGAVPLQERPKLLTAQPVPPQGVFEAIKARHSQRYPLLVPPSAVFGKLLQGEDNALDSVAVFSSLPQGVNNFTLFVGGLSGELELVPNPLWTPESEPTVRRFYSVRKTLAVEYRIPGDPQTRDTSAVIRTSRSWVMR